MSDEQRGTVTDAAATLRTAADRPAKDPENPGPLPVNDGLADPGLRVAFYCNLMGWPKRSSGGVRQWALTMANALVSRGIAVDMLCEAPASKFVDEPLLDPRVGRVILGRGLFARFRLDAYVRSHPGVRLVSALNHYNIGAARLKCRFGARVHVMLTQRENLSADQSWLSRGKYGRAARAARELFSRADAVVSVSQGLTEDLRDNFGVDPARLHTIYNPAYRESFVAAADDPVDHPWIRELDLPLIIAAGRLHHVKGFDDLLTAFAALRAQRPARLVILGEGKARPQLEQRIRELGLGAAAQLPGRAASIAPWMARADLFVLSSRREGLPAVLIEALAMGMNVVATRCPSGPEEILEDGRWGRLVPVGDPAALAHAMLEALQHPPADRAALKARAASFSLEHALARYLGLWRRAALP
jgi:glycosyltransferase involved in cell wall biosynthesis